MECCSSPCKNHFSFTFPFIYMLFVFFSLSLSLCILSHQFLFCFPSFPIRVQFQKHSFIVGLFPLHVCECIDDDREEIGHQRYVSTSIVCAWYAPSCFFLSLSLFYVLFLSVLCSVFSLCWIIPPFCLRIFVCPTFLVSCLSIIMHWFKFKSYGSNSIYSIHIVYIHYTYV